MYFTSNDRFQNMFVYQPAPDTLQLKKEKGIDYILSWNQRKYIILNLNHYILLYYIA